MPRAKRRRYMSGPDLTEAETLTIPTASTNEDQPASVRARPHAGRIAQPALPLQAPEATEKGLPSLDPRVWAGSSLILEDSLQQIAPFVGKMKCTIASSLIRAFSDEGSTILDPFSGCGVVPLESLLLNRAAVANDLHPYAYTITRAKLSAPPNLPQALDLAERYMGAAEKVIRFVRPEDVPDWVRKFFHPTTLVETVALATLLRAQEQWFLLGCLLGILQHVRPGFLSFPASHLTPYLREAKYPRDEFPEMYQYRDVRSRLLAKVERMYRRHTDISPDIPRRVLVEDARSLSLEAATIDGVISSPPYFDALDYARDNRLRLWFLGVPDYRIISPALITTPGAYLADMTACLREMHRVLKPRGYCVLVLGDVERNGAHRNTAELLAEIAAGLSEPFSVEGIVADSVPDERRSRRRTTTTKVERILVLRKRR